MQKLQKKNFLLSKDSFKYLKTTHKPCRSLFTTSTFVTRYIGVNWILLIGIGITVVGLSAIIHGHNQGGLLLTELDVAKRNLSQLLSIALDHPCNLIFDVNLFTHQQFIDAARLTYFYQIEIFDAIRIVNFINVTNVGFQLDAFVGDQSLIQLFKVTQVQLDSEGFLQNLRQILLSYDARLHSIAPGESSLIQETYNTRVSSLSLVRGLT
jgi:hypothetical protein